MWTFLAAGVAGLLLADLEWRSTVEADGTVVDPVDHRVAVLAPAQVATLQAHLQGARLRMWTPDCLSAPLEVRWTTDDGRAESWPIDRPCLERTHTELSTDLLPVLDALEEPTHWAWRVRLPATTAESALADLQWLVVDAGLPSARVSVEGAVLGEGGPTARAAARKRSEALVEALRADLPVHSTGSAIGAGRTVGALDLHTEARVIRFERGADLSSLPRLAWAHGGRVDRVEVPRRWTALVVLDTADPAEAAARIAVPGAEVTPW